MKLFLNQFVVFSDRFFRFNIHGLARSTYFVHDAVDSAALVCLDRNQLPVSLQCRNV